MRNNMPSTVVTAFFDLASKENSNRLKRDATFYLEKGKDLLSKDINLVIYTEDKFSNYVLEQKKTSWTKPG